MMHPWALLISELFEAAFRRSEAQISQTDLFDLLDGFEHGALANPYAMGEKHPAFPDREIYVYQAPALHRLPRVNFLFGIDREKGQIRLYNMRVG